MCQLKIFPHISEMCYRPGDMPFPKKWSFWRYVYSKKKVGDMTTRKKSRRCATPPCQLAVSLWLLCGLCQWQHWWVSSSLMADNVREYLLAGSCWKFPLVPVWLCSHSYSLPSPPQVRHCDAERHQPLGRPGHQGEDQGHDGGRRRRRGRGTGHDQEEERPILRQNIVKGKDSPAARSMAFAKLV